MASNAIKPAANSTPSTGVAPGRSGGAGGTSGTSNTAAAGNGAAPIRSTGSVNLGGVGSLNGAATVATGALAANASATAVWSATDGAGVASGGGQVFVLGGNPSTRAPDAGAARGANSVDASGFTAVRELGSVPITANVTAVIRLPADTFQHATQAGDFKLSATMADGSPLPSWAAFDSASGTFTLTPPAGTAATLAVTVTARDRQGKAAAVDLALTVAQGGNSR